MQAVILAAGKGMRLRPVTETTPKPMIDLCGKPLIEYTLDSLPDAIQEIVIVVNYLKDQIMDHVGDDWNGTPVRYFFQDPLNGTGGALDQLKDELSNKFLVMNADDLYDQGDLARLVAHDLGILLMPTMNPIADAALIDDKNNFVSLEKHAPDSETKLFVCGAYVLDERFYKYPLSEISVHDHKEFGLPQTLVSMGSDCPIKAEIANFWMQVGTLDQLTAAREWCSGLTK